MSSNTEYSLNKICVYSGLSSNADRYKARIATHANRLAAETFKTINMERRLERKHPADLTRDMTLQTRGWYPAGGSHRHVNITVKKFYQMSKLDKLWIQIIKKRKTYVSLSILFFWASKTNKKTSCFSQRSYRVESTRSRPITKVKQRWARVVLGWVTAWELRVVLASFSFFFFIYLFIYSIYFTFFNNQLLIIYNLSIEKKKCFGITRLLRHILYIILIFAHTYVSLSILFFLSIKDK